VNQRIEAQDEALIRLRVGDFAVFEQG